MNIKELGGGVIFADKEDYDYIRFNIIDVDLTNYIIGKDIN